MALDGERLEKAEEEWYEERELDEEWKTHSKDRVVHDLHLPFSSSTVESPE